MFSYCIRVGLLLIICFVQILERLRGNLDSTGYLTAACPRGIHTDGSCTCYSSSSAEEAGARTGIPRIFMLAEAIFEVLLLVFAVKLFQACNTCVFFEEIYVLRYNRSRVTSV